MPRTIPQGNNERVTWSLNFEDKFPPLAADLGFSTAEADGLVNDSQTMRFVILNGQAATAFSKASNEFKYTKLGDSTDGKNQPPVPPYNPVEQPATIAGTGILRRLNAALARIKTSPNFNDDTAELLMINQPETDGDDDSGAKPKGEGAAMTNSVVRIDWTKGKFDGVVIEGQRGDQTAWERLDRDFRSPFEDTRPPLGAGKPEERRYRLIYFIDNQPVGVWSDIIVVITLP